MKKEIFYKLIIFFMVIGSLIGCSKIDSIENVQEKIEEKTTQAKIGKITKVEDMLYEVIYDDYSLETPDNLAFDDLAGEMGCSGVRNGNFVGRNFDYFMNQSPTFVVHTTAKEDRYATIGVGRLAKVKADEVEKGLSQEKIENLPWIILDGMNEKGVVVTSNVTSKKDWGDIPHTETKPGASELNVIFIVRAVLDKCATVDEAIAYLNEHNITPMGSDNYDLHFMISDPKKTYVVEFINNKVVVKEQNIMTNYFVNLDEIPAHPIGLERMQILKKNYDEGNTMEGMYNLMQRVRYTNAYQASNKWYSEFDLGYFYDQKANEEMDEIFNIIQQQFEEEKEYLKKNGFREKTNWWDTVHNTIYDMKNKKIWVTVHERYQEGPHEFGFDFNGVKNNEFADLVVYGTIYTAENENNGLADAFAVKDGKYIYVGTKEGAKQYIKEGETKIVDRSNQGLIIPGCTEGHSHYFDGTGLNSQLPGSDCNYDEVLKILKEQVETKGIKQFVSFGWNSYELVEKRKSGFNFAKEIEDIAPNIPVVLIDNTGHGALCNTTALKRAGLMDNPMVRGGKVELNNNGEPNGYVGDQAVFYVVDKVIDKPLNEQQYKNACLYGMNKLLELGYTNALDAFTNMYGSVGLYEALKKMDDNGELKMNVAACYNIKSYDVDIYKDRVDEVVDIVNNYSSPHLNPGYIKLFADGVVESGTGWMFEEYKNAEKGKEHGNIIWTPDELNALVEYANSKNILIHTHTYGDAACNTMLDAYIASNEKNGKEYRNCLGHVRNIKEEDIIRAAENKIPIAENLIWHADYDENSEGDKKIKDILISTIGEELYYSGYPMKSLIDKGVIMSSSTDAPAAMAVEGSIMNVLEVSVTGITPDDKSKAFGTNELLTVKEGLKALTIDGAKQLGLEKERGSIKEGKFADFVVLEKNVLDYKKEDFWMIGDTKILNTYFEGQNVYTNK